MTVLILIILFSYVGIAANRLCIRGVKLDKPPKKKIISRFLAISLVIPFVTCLAIIFYEIYRSLKNNLTELFREIKFFIQ